MENVVGKYIHNVFDTDNANSFGWNQYHFYHKQFIVPYSIFYTPYIKMILALILSNCHTPENYRKTCRQNSNKSEWENTNLPLDCFVQGHLIIEIIQFST